MPKFLMCRPDHFKIGYTINPWMKPEAWEDGDWFNAVNEWVALVAVLKEAGAEIAFIEPQPDLPDLVFTANHGVVLNSKFMAPCFKCPERKPERPHIIDFFLKYPGVNDFCLTKTYFEGAGDCIFDKRLGIFWLGHGQRTDENVKQEIANFFEVPVVPLELIDPRFYHLDTAMMVLPQGETLYYPDAFSQKSRAIIAETKSFAIGSEDAENFSANCISIGNLIIMSHCSMLLEKRLSEFGYTVIRTPLPTFHKSGGSAYCLTLRLD